jgi:hypothetical protein
VTRLLARWRDRALSIFSSMSLSTGALVVWATLTMLVIVIWKTLHHLGGPPWYTPF